MSTKNKSFLSVDNDLVDSAFECAIGLAAFLSSLCDSPVDLKVEEVMFNPPATIVRWSDGTKTVAKCSPEDTFNEELGFAMACTKKLIKPYDTIQDLIKNAIRVKPKAKKPCEKKNHAVSDIKLGKNDDGIETVADKVNELFRLIADDFNEPISKIKIKVEG